MTLLGVRVIPLDTEVGYVFVHGKAAVALGVVLIYIDADVQVTLLFFSDIMVFFEGILKLVVVVVAYIFNTKVVDDEAEEDRESFLAPNTRSGGVLVVSVLV